MEGQQQDHCTEVYAEKCKQLVVVENEAVRLSGTGEPDHADSYIPSKGFELYPEVIKMKKKLKKQGVFQEQALDDGFYI